MNDTGVESRLIPTESIYYTAAQVRRDTLLLQEARQALSASCAALRASRAVSRSI